MSQFTGRLKIGASPQDVGAMPDTYTDGAGRRWFFRRYVISKTYKLMDSLNSWAWSSDPNHIVRLIQKAAYHPEPGLKIIFRRMIGLRDYSIKDIRTKLTIKEMKHFGDQIVSANFMQTLDKYFEAYHNVKKKTTASRIQMRIFTASLLGPFMTPRASFLVKHLKA